MGRYMNVKCSKVPSLLMFLCHVTSGVSAISGEADN